MSAWTKFATNFFHQKQKQNSEYKFSQALKEASKVYKKTKGGSSKKQRGGRDDGKKKMVNGVELDCEEEDEDEQCKVVQEEVVDEGQAPAPAPAPAQILYKVDDQGNITDEPCDPTSDEYNDNEKCKPKPATGGKKSQKKAKKAGKKSQKKSKKAKKAGSKKSKK